ncbi:GTP cyclohydrolase FolE2 [Anoxybacillus sp. D401a]|uniref:GTP cyclohydrolase FolE2 n=1 Tax=Anoxybacillus sp. D401a TaxID=575112 RepID=UPI003D34B495
MEHIHLPKKEDRLIYFGSTNPLMNKTKPTDKEQMVDLQSEKKDFFFHIDHVGICNVSHPITIESSMKPHVQTTIGTFTLTTSLNRDEKGINMSRLTELLHEYYEKNWRVTLRSLQAFSKDMAERMKQRKSTVSIRYPWYYEKAAPETAHKGMMHANVLTTMTYEHEKGWKASVGIDCTVTTLCPCSKEISEYSAHNQRGIVSIIADLQHDAEWPENFKEQLLHIAESNASSQMYSVLKRPDEKYVTERAYENPRFVEDLIRLIAADLYEQPWVKCFHITCRNEESIHLHDAYAQMSFRK